MKKLLATLTTVAMLATTTSAFAAEPIANDAGFDKAAGTYSVAADLRDVEGQLTLLIIPEAAYLADAIEDADILYIDQGAYADGLFQNVGILGGTELKPGNYYAKIGGKELGGIIVEKFTVVAEEEEGTKITVKWGDITGDNAVTSSDAIAALMNFAGYAETYTVNGYDVAVGSDFGGYKWGDITGDNAVTSSDAIAALMNFAGYAETYTVNGAAIAVGSNVEIEIN